MRWYIGCVQDFCLGTYHYEAFQHAGNPTPETTPRYTYVVGPFRTKRAAKWAEEFGARNPHFGSVADAERISASTRLMTAH